MTRYLWSERIGPGYIHGYEICPLYEKRTKFQRLLIFSNEQWGKGLILDGIVQTTLGDEFIYHEMMVHVPILARNKDTESVLIIGGGDGGVLREVQRYKSIRRIVQVELDEDVIIACRKYLPEICGDWNDKRVELIIGDGAKYVKEARERGEKFDVIILDSTDPIGPAIVLFERPFHEDLAAILKDDGIVVRQSGLPVTMPKVMPFIRKRFLHVFENVSVYMAPMPTFGGEIAFVAGTKDKGLSITEPKREFSGRYYNPSIHKSSFTLPNWWRDLIVNFKDDGKVPVETPSYW